MINLKSEEEIKMLARGGRLLSEILNKLNRAAKPGVKTIELDAMAESLIKRIGGRPSFKNYQSLRSDPPFPTAICASVNNELVHTPAGELVLRSGDILSIDIGMEYQGLFTDMATTVAIGKISLATEKLLKVTKKSLDLAIAVVKPGNMIGDIGRIVQEFVESQGYFVVKDLVGHGVGYAVHEDPRVPNFVAVNQPKIEMVPGMVIAIEPMVNVGTDRVKFSDEEWTVTTADGSLCAHFEHTIAVTKRGHLVLTK